MMTTGTRSMARAFVSAIVAVLYLAMSVRAAFPLGNADEEVRLALVIGNSRYETIAPLKNPANDEKLIAHTLQRLGFRVVQGRDLSIAEFREVVRDFAQQAKNADAVVFYYAGHGFQYDGENFLVPVDARLKDRDKFVQETFALNDIVKKLQKRGRDTLIFLDACRNNPIPKSAGVSRDTGLAQIEDAGGGAGGLYLAYATQPGNVTLDGSAANSPFAKALAKHLPSKGLGVSDMMTRVRTTVEMATNGTQVPWDVSILRSPFYFNPSDEVGDLSDEDLAQLNELPKELREKVLAQLAGTVPEEESQDEYEMAAVDPEDMGAEDLEAPADDSEAAEVAEDPEVPAADEAATEPEADSQTEARPADAAEDTSTELPAGTKVDRPKVDPGISETTSDDISDSLEPKTADALPQGEEVPVPAQDPATVEAAKPVETLEAVDTVKPVERIAPETVAEEEAPPDLLLNDAEDPTLDQRLKEEPADKPAASPTISIKIAGADDTAAKTDAGNETIDKLEPAGLPDTTEITKSEPEIAGVDDAATVPETKTDNTAASAPAQEADEPALTLDAAAEDDGQGPALELGEDDPAPEPLEEKKQPDVAVKPADTAEATLPATDLDGDPSPEVATNDTAVAKPDPKPDTTAVADEKPAQEVAAVTPDRSEEDNRIDSLVEVDSADAKATAASPVVSDTESLLPRISETTPVEQKKEDAPMEMASVDTQTSKPELNLGTQVAPDDAAAAKTDEDNKDEPELKDYAEEIQQELSRLGCFRSKVDGKWGPKSDSALIRYIANSKRDISLERNEQLLANLKSDTTTSCPAETKVASNKSSKSNKDGKSASTSGKKSTANKTAANSNRTSKTASKNSGNKAAANNKGGKKASQPQKKAASTTAKAPATKKKLKIGGGVSF